MMDDGTNDEIPPFDADNPDNKGFRKDMVIRRLIMQANSLNQAIAYLWDNYQDLFDAVDLNDEEMHDKCCDTLMQLDHNLSGILEGIRDQQSVMCGYFEPIPDMSSIEGDFEATVLRGIADLDNFDFSVYDKSPIERDEAPNVKDLIREAEDKVNRMSMEDLVKHVRKQYYD